ncbi:hypothetical protein BHE74_00023556 [Ensete ventricosum]|nr:hypothetical protein BHE74_00023556 [Ensete ventricosum]
MVYFLDFTTEEDNPVRWHYVKDFERHRRRHPPIGVELRCQLDLFTSECASPSTSVGIETSCVDWRSLSSPRPERRSADPSGITILHTGLFGNGRVDPVRPL